MPWIDGAVLIAFSNIPVKLPAEVVKLELILATVLLDILHALVDADVKEIPVTDPVLAPVKVIGTVGLLVAISPMILAEAVVPSI